MKQTLFWVLLAFIIALFLAVVFLVIYLFKLRRRLRRMSFEQKYEARSNSPVLPLVTDHSVENSSQKHPAWLSDEGTDVYIRIQQPSQRSAIDRQLMYNNINTTYEESRIEIDQSIIEQESQGKRRST